MKIPARYQDADLESFIQSHRDLMKTVVDDRKSLYFYGNVGAGKTHAVYAIANYVGVDNIRVFNVPDVLRSIRDDFSRHDDEKSRIVDHIAGYRRYVAFDDIGVEKSSDWVVETLYGLINERYEHILPTIFTSNLAIGELSTKIDDRIASRIAEMCTVINFSGTDRRIS